jgi:hypothetical protein
MRAIPTARVFVHIDVLEDLRDVVVDLFDAHPRELLNQHCADIAIGERIFDYWRAVTSEPTYHGSTTIGVTLPLVTAKAYRYEMLSRWLPDDRPRVQAAFQKAIDRAEAFAEQKIDAFATSAFEHDPHHRDS